jgi:short-subunit dehydrogenase
MKGVALVTGAGRGLGRILATFLAGQGYDIVITARTDTELHDVAQSLESMGIRVAAIPGDITEPRHRTRLLQHTRAMGGLSLLVNNASDLGETPRPELARASLQRFRQRSKQTLSRPSRSYKKPSHNSNRRGDL